MRLPYNAFKAALRNRQPQIGMWLGLADPSAAELCATCRFDWLVIDGEHTPHDLRSLRATLQAVDSANALGLYTDSPTRRTHPIVRIGQGDATLIKQVLELGADTLLVPMVDTAQQAQALVQAMRYPPQGIRGVGSGLARSSRWSLIEDYLHNANEQVCLLVQAETQAALSNLNAISTTEGVDGVFIGPADLAASMGYLGQPNHPEVVQAIEHAISQVLAASKAPGILCTDETLAHHYEACGALFVAVGVDTTILAQGARELARRFQSTPL